MEDIEHSVIWAVVCDLFRIAITHKLILAGVVPATALRLAGLFCDGTEPGRLPGQLFPFGRTILIAKPDGTGVILNLPPDQIIDDVLTADVSIIVDLGKIVRRVNARLGLTTKDANVDAILN